MVISHNNNIKEKIIRAFIFFFRLILKQNMIRVFLSILAVAILVCAQDKIATPCDEICKGGGCYYEHCTESATCPGGACEFVNCIAPTCNGNSHFLYLCVRHTLSMCIGISMSDIPGICVLDVLKFSHHLMYNHMCFVLILILGGACKFYSSKGAVCHGGG